MNTNRTFAELQQAIATEMQLDPGLISASERQAFINDCLSNLGAMGMFEKDGTLTIVDGFADLPDDLVDVLEVYNGNTYIQPIETATVMTGTTITGYIVRYNKLESVPRVTSAELRIYYAYKPTKLVGDLDKPDIPNGYDKLIIDWAVGHAHRKNGNIGLYREYLGAFAEGKSDLIMELTKRANSRVMTTHNKDFQVLAPAPYEII